MNTKASDKVFPTIPAIRTVYQDFAKADIVPVDDQGRHADLHGLHTTLGTCLARAAVAPQLAMRIMRHADVKTTMKHYTDLRFDSRPFTTAGDATRTRNH